MRRLSLSLHVDPFTRLFSLTLLLIGLLTQECFAQVWVPTNAKASRGDPNIPNGISISWRNPSQNQALPNQSALIVRSLSYLSQASNCFSFVGPAPAAGAVTQANLPSGVELVWQGAPVYDGFTNEQSFTHLDSPSQAVLRGRTYYYAVRIASGSSWSYCAQGVESQPYSYFSNDRNILGWRTGYSISGTLTLPGGDPAAGVRIYSNHYPSGISPRLYFTSISQTDGSFSFQNMPAAFGTYPHNIDYKDPQTSSSTPPADGYWVCKPSCLSGGGSFSCASTTPVEVTTSDISGITLKAISGWPYSGLSGLAYRVSGTVALPGGVTPLPSGLSNGTVRVRADGCDYTVSPLNYGTNGIYASTSYPSNPGGGSIPKGTYQLIASPQTSGTYTIEPSNFNNPQTISIGHLENRNFLASSTSRYSISGKVFRPGMLGLGGVSVTASASGQADITVQSQADGTYSFVDQFGNPLLPVGIYTLSASKSGYNISNMFSGALSIVSANITAKDFVAISNQTVQISGNIWFPGHVNGLAGQALFADPAAMPANFTCSAGSCTITTGSGSVINLRVSAASQAPNGAFVLNVPEGLYNLYPSSAGNYSYSPASHTNLAATANLPGRDFEAISNARFSISGVVRDDNNQPLSGVAINVFKAQTQELQEATYTSSDGSYTVGDLPQGAYDVHPLLLNYAFQISGSWTQPVIVGPNNASGRNFTGISTLGETVSGKVVRIEDPSTGVPGVNVQLDASLQTSTDQNGNFVFSNVSNGQYTLTASHPNYDIFPSQGIQVLVNGSDIDNLVLSAREIKPVIPILEGVLDNQNGTFTACFGYDNQNQIAVQITPGASDATNVNTFGPPLPIQGQPLDFQIGRVPGAFCVTADNSVSLTWTVRYRGLQAHAATATSASIERLEPIALQGVCVKRNIAGNFEARFSYHNPNPFDIHTAVGPNNRFIPAPEDRGQPTSFLWGNVMLMPSIEFSAEEGSLTWSVHGSQATVTPDSAACQNQAPVADAGGSYGTISCSSAETQITISAAASSDPDGDQLIYAFSTQCPNSSIVHSSTISPQATLVLSAAGDTSTASCQVTVTVSDGALQDTAVASIFLAPSCFDCRGTPYGAAVVDDCGICAGGNQAKDCAGQCFGPARPDRFGICGGDGTLPPGCISTNYSD
ncbi:MAG: hypothetical protein DCC75_08180, partial [Proteobacteria bacterium]